MRSLVIDIMLIQNLASQRLRLCLPTFDGVGVDSWSPLMTSQATSRELFVFGVAGALRVVRAV